jgi:sec-independent protein translocase protein TatA
MGKLFDSPAALLLILVVIVLFGSKKLPDAARGVGRSLRIFKAETKGLMTDDDGQSVPPAVPQQIAVPPVAVPPTPPAAPAAAPAAPPAAAPAAAPAVPTAEAEKTES